MNERVVSGQPHSEDEPNDRNLRPKRLEEYIGQGKVKNNLEIAIAASKRRGEGLDHILLYGPPGLGKTTLANIVASEMEVRIKTTSGPAIERAGELAAILTSMKKDDILFIDEVHRLNRAVEEVLYPAMEDFALDIIIGKGPGAKSLRLKLPHFTFVGATTRYAMVSAPLRNRFGSVYRLDFYSTNEIVEIVRRTAKIVGIESEDLGLLEIARRARGTPRVANRLLKRVRDFAEVKGDGIISSRIAQEALSQLEVDSLGLDEIDHRVLRTIIENYEGGPVGLDTVAASISEEPDTIQDVYEPFLLQLGFLARTSRGRLATRGAYEHLGIPYTKGASGTQESLFD